MLTGQKEGTQKIFPFPRVLRDKIKGLSLVEVLLSTLILILIIGALFLTLIAGESSNSVSSAKVDLQAKVRLIMDWIVKDVRQTTLIEINNKNPFNNRDPSENYIKFRKVTGIDETTGSGHVYAPSYIEYVYDSVSEELTRNELNSSGAILRSWVFDRITHSPFYTDTDPEVPLAPGGIFGRRLIIVIAARNQVRNILTLNFSLTEEVKIRNE